MRKIKKINGYLVVKFNARELREWEGTALGEYGVIDAELYTGCLEIDRGVMEYDGAETLEEAVELARGLESEEDIVDEPPTFTVTKETDSSFTEDEVEPQLMISGWEAQLKTQVESSHYTDIDPRTAAHELYGFKVALKQLGLIEPDECFVRPDAFRQKPGDGGDFIFSPDGVPTRELYALGVALMSECPANDCTVYRNIFEMCVELDEQIGIVSKQAREVLKRDLRKHIRELWTMYGQNYAVGEYRKARREKKLESPVEVTAPQVITHHAQADYEEHIRKQRKKEERLKAHLSGGSLTKEGGDPHE